MDVDASLASLLDVRANYPDASPAVARAVLRDAAQQLTERGLSSAAKWALELLVCVPKGPRDATRSSRAAAAAGGRDGQRRFKHSSSRAASDPRDEDHAGPSSSSFSFSTPAAAIRSRQTHSQMHEDPRSGQGSPMHGHIYPYQSTPALHPERGGTPSSIGDSIGARSLGMHPAPSPIAPAMAAEEASMPSTSVAGAMNGRLSEASESAHVRFAASAGPSSSQLDPDRSGMADLTYDTLADEKFDARRVLVDDEEQDTFLLAKNLFDHHQWERCAHTLEAHDARSPQSLFLKLYARYLAIERRAEEDYFQATKWIKGKHAPRAALVPLLRELIDPKDPFLLFLKGVIFRKLDKRIEAMDCFLRSLEVFPYNWSAWQELSASLEGGQAELQDIAPMLPDSFMASFFCELFARSSAGRMLTDESLRRIDALLTLFPSAPYLLVCKGQVLHLLQDLEESELAYEAARAVDPLRLDGMADYSNSLFVQNKEEKLAHLTHSLAEAGREDAEVCCAVGNYHTLRGDNHRAVEVFKRAVRLDPSCSSAWILLGHGYIELKDSLAAAEMYRKALELNPRDVRAWTGLGNTYELNSAWAQALHYHKKAAANSPYDYRFWASMANCYDRLGQLPNAVECYKRILTLERGIDQQLLIMDNVARAYEAMAAAAAAAEDNDEDEAGPGTTTIGDEMHSPRMHDMMRACTWHKRIAELIDGAHFEDSSERAARVKEHVASFLVAARWEIELAEKEAHEGAGLSSSSSSSAAAAAAMASGEASRRLSTAAAAVHEREEHVTRAQHYLQRIMMTGTDAIIQAEELQRKLALVQT